MKTFDFTTQDLRAAVSGYERMIADASARRNDLINRLSGHTAQTTETPAKPRKRAMSAAARARISKAQKARWAKYRAEQGR